MKLLDVFDEMKNEIAKEIPYLNYGGCGFFAFYSAKRLIEMGYECNILLLSYHENHYDFINKIENINAMKNNVIDSPRVSLSAYHLIVESNGFIFDSEYISKQYKLELHEIINDYFHVPYIGKYSIEELAIALYQDKTWNDCYDRYYNERLKQIIDKYLS